MMVHNQYCYYLFNILLYFKLILKKIWVLFGEETEIRVSIHEPSSRIISESKMSIMMCVSGVNFYILPTLK